MGFRKGSLQRVRVCYDGFRCEYIHAGNDNADDQADAKEGLKLHGTSYHGKKLKVEQSDPNFNNKKAARYVTLY